MEKININVEESNNIKNGLVVDAESFSIYAVVVNSVSYDVTI